MKLGIRGAVLLIAVSLVASGCSGNDKGSTGSTKGGDAPAERPNGSTAAASDGEKLEWMSCENRLARTANLECARLQVPLDPDKPEGETITLALARQRATGKTADRIGSLVLNPGGPGGSGIEFLAAAGTTFPASLSERFDLVSFDPRGVGESSPVRCLTDAEKNKQLTGDLSPSTEDQIDAAFKDQQVMLKGCERNSPKLLRHMSTADVAADLDQIRVALGDEKLTYAGFSYGTSIGAVYATLFPKNARALVLDGSVSPNSTSAEETLTQAASFESVLGQFESSCNASTACALAPDAAGAIARARNTLSNSPMKVSTESGPRTLGVDQFDLAVATGLYDSSLWGVVADAVSTLKSGGAETLLSLMDQQTGRNADGTFDNSGDAQTMVNCSDTPDRPTRSEVIDLAGQVAAVAPTFGPALGWSLINCVGWPETANPLPKITGAGAPPILVVGTKGDPATPYAWSQAMTSALESATLLTYEGAGHTAFTKAGACIDDAVVNYLIDLKVPAAGTSCPANTDSVSFESLSQQVVSMMVKGGLPEDIAHCIVKSAIADLGESEFNKMVLGQDTEEITQLIMAKTLSCVQKKK